MEKRRTKLNFHLVDFRASFVLYTLTNSVSKLFSGVDMDDLSLTFLFLIHTADCFNVFVFIP